jgi:hypothetical protein
MSDKDKPAEFPSDEHRTNHILALKREAEGYEAKATGAQATGDETSAALYKSRGEQVSKELSRLADSARPNRGATRAQ